MKMKLAAFTCLLFLDPFAFMLADNPGNGIHKFTEGWLPGSKWTDSFEAFDGYQISPATESTPALNSKENSVISGEILPAYESYIKDSTTSAMDLADRDQISGQSTSKNNDTEVKVVKRYNDGKENGWKSKIDPALIRMRLGKRLPAYDPDFNTIGFNSRQFFYYPSSKNIGMGKRKHHFDPALKYMGIGKRDRGEISEDSSGRNIPYSALEEETNIDHSQIFNPTPIIEGTTEADFEPRQVEGYPPEVMGSLGSSPFEEGNALNYKLSVAENEDFESNRIEALKNKEGIPISDNSNSVDDNHTDKSKDRSTGKTVVYEILSAKNRPEVLDVLRRNFGNNSPSIKHGVNGGIRLEISPKRFKELTDSNALAIKEDVGKRNIRRQSLKKFSYDPALKYMGLGKRQKNRGGQISNYDPAFQYMGLGKRNDADATFKRESYDPAFKYMGLGKRNNTDVHSKRVSFDPAFQYMGLGKREDGEVKRQSYDPAFQYMGLGKRKDTELNSKRESYDPAFQYMGLGKREDGEVKRQSYDPAFQYMGLGKRKDTELNSKRESYDPAFQYMGLGKRKDVEINSKRESYDPAFQYMGLGKRKDSEVKRQSYDPAFQYMGLGKRKDTELNSKRESYDPAFQYMGLGKRKDGEVKRHSYDPAFQYMGLGKRKDTELNSIRESYEPAFQYMWLRKRKDGEVKRHSYDPAFQYMGLGKRKDTELNSKRESYDPAFQYMGLGKRNDGEVKRQSYDPAFQYMGLGKRKDVEINSEKESEAYDPAFQNMGLGKRNDAEVSSKRESYDPAYQYMGLGKRENDNVNSEKQSSDSGYKHIDFSKGVKSRGIRSANFDPALKYLGLGKRVNDGTLTRFDLLYKRESSHKEHYFPSLGEMSSEKSKKYRATPVSNYDPAFRYMGLGKREKSRQHSSSFDPALKYMGLGKRGDSFGKGFYDPAFKYMGLGKRMTNRGSRASHFDPALKYLGLGKREVNHLIFTKSISYDPSKKNRRTRRSAGYDPALQYMGLGKRETLGGQDIIPGHESELKRESNKRSSKQIARYNPALNYIGLGKREDRFYNKEEMKRFNKFDPTLQYMGLGKRQQHPKPVDLKNDVTSELQLLESLFADSTRVKRQIESEEEDEAYPNLHRIDNIDTPQGILPFKTDDLERPLINMTAWDDDYSEEVILLPEHLHGPYLRECHYLRPCNRDPRNDKIMLPLIQTSDAGIIERAPPQKMQILPEVKENETNSTEGIPHRIQDLPEIKTSEDISTDSARHLLEYLPENKTSETSSTDRVRHVMHGLSDITTSEASSTDRNLHRKQDFPEIKTSEASSTDRALHSIEELQDIKTPETSSNNIHRRIRDLLGIEASASSFSDTDPRNFYGINAPETNSIEMNPKIDHRQDKSRNEFKVEGAKRAMERSENRISSVKRNMIDIDNRPRYNPGWVFIGLGKRSSSSMDTNMSFLTKCYYLLGKINDALMKLQYRKKKVPLQLQPDPFGFTHNTAGKNMKGKNMKGKNMKGKNVKRKNVKARARDLRIAPRSFRRMEEDEK